MNIFFGKGIRLEEQDLPVRRILQRGKNVWNYNPRRGGDVTDRTK